MQQEEVNKEAVGCVRDFMYREVSSAHANVLLYPECLYNRIKTNKVNKTMLVLPSSWNTLVEKMYVLKTKPRVSWQHYWKLHDKSVEPFSSGVPDAGSGDKCNGRKAGWVQKIAPSYHHSA